MAGNFLLCLMVLCTAIGSINCLGYIETNFKQFENFEGRKFDGSCCDNPSFWSWGTSDDCSNECDHRFVICMGNGTQSSSMSACEFGHQEVEKVGGNKISFNSHVGKSENPIKFKFGTWPGVVKLKIDVQDEDSENDFDFVDHYEYQHNTRDLRRKIDAPVESLVLTGTRTRFNLELKVYCEVNYYGQDCETYCIETDDDTGHYKCDPVDGDKICKPGWTGKECLTNIDDCVGNRCSFGSTCVDDVNFYSCLCPPGRTGFLCQAEINECASAPCQNGGKCLDASNSFICECAPGFAGPVCEVEIDECFSGPCLNGGTCLDEIASFECICQAGYSGDRCEIDTDECVSNPCIRAERCVNLPGDYRCDCFPGFEGKNCDHNINECISSPCKNGGWCIDEINSFRCICQHGFTGSLCEDRVNYCEPNYCQNGATCSSLKETYECHCTEQFTGKTCGDDVDECRSDTQLCGDNGICVNTVGDYNCLCNEGYEGQFCETETDECLISKTACLNDGLCIDLINDFKCDCTGTGFTGSRCQEEIDECESSPCENDGSCIDMLNGFVCNCSDGFRGDRCKTATTTSPYFVTSTSNDTELSALITLSNVTPETSSLTVTIPEIITTLGIDEESSPSPLFNITIDNVTHIENITTEQVTGGTEKVNKSFILTEEYSFTEQNTDGIDRTKWNITTYEVPSIIKNVTETHSYRTISPTMRFRDDVNQSTEYPLSQVNLITTESILEQTESKETSTPFDVETGKNKDYLSPTPTVKIESSWEVTEAEKYRFPEDSDEYISSGLLPESEEYISGEGSGLRSSVGMTESAEQFSSGDTDEYMSSGQITYTEGNVSSVDQEYESSGDIVAVQEYISSSHQEYVSSGDIVDKEEHIPSGDQQYVSSGDIVDKEEHISSGDQEYVSSGDIVDEEEYISPGDQANVSSGDTVDKEEYISSGDQEYESSGDIVAVQEYISSSHQEYVSSGDIVEKEEHIPSGDQEYVFSGDIVDKEEHISSGDQEYVSSGDIVDEEEYISPDDQANVSSGDTVDKKEYISSGDQEYESSGDIVAVQEYISSSHQEYVSSGDIVDKEEHIPSGDQEYVSSGDVVDKEEHISSGDQEYVSSGDIVDEEEYISPGDQANVSSGDTVDKEEYISSGDQEYVSSGDIVPEEHHISSGDQEAFSSKKAVDKQKYIASSDQENVSSGDIVDEEVRISSGDQYYISSGDIADKEEYISSGDQENVSSGDIVDEEEYISPGDQANVSSGDTVDKKEHISSGDQVYKSSGDVFDKDEHISSGDQDYVSSGDIADKEEYISSGDQAYKSSGDVFDKDEHISSDDQEYVSSGVIVDEEEYISPGDQANVSSGDTVDKEEYISSGDQAYKSSGDVVDKDEHISSDDQEYVSSGDIVDEEEYISPGDQANVSSGDTVDKEEYISSGDQAYKSSGDVVDKDEHISSGDQGYVSSGDIADKEEYILSGDQAYVSSGDIVDEEEYISSGDQEYVSSGDIVDEEEYISSSNQANVSSGDVVDREELVTSVDQENVSSGEIVQTEDLISSGDQEYVSSGDIPDTEEHVSSGDQEYVSSDEIVKKEEHIGALSTVATDETGSLETTGESIFWTSSEGQVAGDSAAKLIDYTEFNIVSSGDGEFIEYKSEGHVRVKSDPTTTYQTKPNEGVTVELTTEQFESSQEGLTESSDTTLLLFGSGDYKDELGIVTKELESSQDSVLSSTKKTFFKDHYTVQPTSGSKTIVSTASRLTSSFEDTERIRMNESLSSQLTDFQLTTPFNSSRDQQSPVQYMTDSSINISSSPFTNTEFEFTTSDKVTRKSSSSQERPVQYTIRSNASTSSSLFTAIDIQSTTPYTLSPKTSPSQQSLIRNTSSSHINISASLFTASKPSRKSEKTNSAVLSTKPTTVSTITDTTTSTTSSTKAQGIPIPPWLIAQKRFHVSSTTTVTTPKTTKVHPVNPWLAAKMHLGRKRQKLRTKVTKAPTLPTSAMLETPIFVISSDKSNISKVNETFYKSPSTFHLPITDSEIEAQQPQITQVMNTESSTKSFTDTLSTDPSQSTGKQLITEMTPDQYTSKGLFHTNDTDESTSNIIFVDIISSSTTPTNLSSGVESTTTQDMFTLVAPVSETHSSITDHLSSRPHEKMIEKTYLYTVPTMAVKRSTTLEPISDSMTTTASNLSDSRNATTKSLLSSSIFDKEIAYNTTKVTEVSTDVDRDLSTENVSNEDVSYSGFITRMIKQTTRSYDDVHSRTDRQDMRSTSPEEMDETTSLEGLKSTFPTMVDTKIPKSPTSLPCFITEKCGPLPTIPKLPDFLIANITMTQPDEFITESTDGKEGTTTRLPVQVTSAGDLTSYNTTSATSPSIKQIISGILIHGNDSEIIKSSSAEEVLLTTVKRQTTTQELGGIWSPETTIEVTNKTNVSHLVTQSHIPRSKIEKVQSNTTLKTKTISPDLLTRRTTRGHALEDDITSSTRASIALTQSMPYKDKNEIEATIALETNEKISTNVTSYGSSPTPFRSSTGIASTISTPDGNATITKVYYYTTVQSDKATTATQTSSTTAKSKQEIEETLDDRISTTEKLEETVSTLLQGISTPEGSIRPSSTTEKLNDRVATFVESTESSSTEKLDESSSASQHSIQSSSTTQSIQSSTTTEELDDRVSTSEQSMQSSSTTDERLDDETTLKTESDIPRAVTTEMLNIDIGDTTARPSITSDGYQKPLQTPVQIVISEDEQEIARYASVKKWKEYVTDMRREASMTDETKRFQTTTRPPFYSMPKKKTESSTLLSVEKEQAEYIYTIRPIEETFEKEELSWSELLKTVIETTTSIITTVFPGELASANHTSFTRQATKVTNTLYALNKTIPPENIGSTTEQPINYVEDFKTQSAESTYTTNELNDSSTRETPVELQVESVETTTIPISSSLGSISTKGETDAPYILRATILTYFSKWGKQSANVSSAQTSTEATVASSVSPTTKLSKVRHEVDLTAQNVYPNPRKEIYEYIRNKTVTRGKATLTFQKIRITVIRGYQEGKRIVLQTYQRVKDIATTVVVTTYRRSRELLEQALQRIEALWQYCKTGIDHYIVKPLLNAQVLVKSKFEQTYAQLSEIFNRGKEILKMTTDNVREEVSTYFDSLTKYYTDVYRQYSTEVRDIFESLKIPDS